jgi:hypothetical protein
MRYMGSSWFGGYEGYNLVRVVSQHGARREQGIHTLALPYDDLRCNRREEDLDRGRGHLRLSRSLRFNFSIVLMNMNRHHVNSFEYAVHNTMGACSNVNMIHTM